MTVTDGIVCVVFLAWLALSLISQWKPSWLASMKYHDVLHLIPNWRFFAPIPARKDYHLEYRLQIGTGRAGRWRRLLLITPRTPWCALWYPAKRTRKAFNTCVRRISRVMHKHGSPAVANSLSYLHLLNFLQHRNEVAGARALQFRIVTSQDFTADPWTRLVYTSSWHYRDTT